MPLDGGAGARYSQGDALMCNPAQCSRPVWRHPVLLYYITDRKQFGGSVADQVQKLLEKIHECAVAGVDYIQLREKDLTARELEQLAAKAMAAIPGGSVTRLLINSRIDVTLACAADGVHLPANSLTPSEARAIFARAGKSNTVIGISTHSAAEVASAEAHGADFAVFGPVFEKAGATNRHGLPQLAAVTRRSLPVLALGGITLENATRCAEAGSAGIAAIRMFQQADAKTTVEALRRLWATRRSAVS
jgi:thiamine-phosphate pyrophosphorylase